MSNTELEQTIDAAWENRAEIGLSTCGEVRIAVDRALALLDSGAARVALGPDLPPFYTDDEALAAEIAAASTAVEDPLWRMPLWQPYQARLASRIADTNNVTTDGFAGSITAALFLRRFVEKTPGWVHFDIFAWNPWERPHGQIGGEAQGIRALEKVICGRFG